MRRGLGVVATALSVVVASIAPVAYGDTSTTDASTTTTENTTTTTQLVGQTETLTGASRGTVVQITPTLPPPPTTAPPPPLPLRSPFVAPLDSGSGRRVVYSKGVMRVWQIRADNSIERSYLVSGRLSQPNYGTYYVFSRSTYTCNINHPNVCMRWMVRFTTGPSGDNIGFHEIPREDGWPLQSESQLGTARSSGCVRQATVDAMWMWVFAPIGTKVVVIP